MNQHTENIFKECLDVIEKSTPEELEKIWENITPDMFENYTLDDLKKSIHIFEYFQWQLNSFHYALKSKKE